MITRIQIRGFKSLRDVDLSLGALNLFIGANASGKSNFFDALRLLQGIGYGFTIDEIFNGKPKSAAAEVWEPIRGGLEQVGFRNKASIVGGTIGEVALRLEVHGRLEPTGSRIVYSITIAVQNAVVAAEKLLVDDVIVYHSRRGSVRTPTISVDYKSSNGAYETRKFERDRPLLTQLFHLGIGGAEYYDLFEHISHLFRDIQHLNPSPAVLREYSQARSVLRMGEHGENFAALVQSIIADKKTRTAYVSWLRELTPSEVDDITIERGALKEALFALKEGNVSHPAPVLSDGTLRFAAIAAAFFQRDMPGMLTIEEIENGIHPTRLRLLVELLKSRSGRGPQVMGTTHSPMLLAWLDESDYKTTFFCRRDKETGASIIKPLSAIPHFMEIARSQSIAELFAEGWFEGEI